MSSEELAREMVINGHNCRDLFRNILGCEDYIQALEAERRKIIVFQRELPLCLELVTQVIDLCKQQLSGTTPATVDCNLNGQSDCNSEQTSSDIPVFEEFIPIKRPLSSSICDEEHECKKPRNDCNKDEQNSGKSDWLRSVQLWNQSADPRTKKDPPKRVAVVEVKRDGSGGAFHPFKKENKSDCATTPSAPPASASSTVGEAVKIEKEGQSQRKARRCWSPELHLKFLQALEQLGGSHVATPKQIREVMKIDGLTNDEVKSHLQKYRFHARRPIQTDSNQPPQFAVVVGGIWAVPPPYAAVTSHSESETVSGNEIYAPVATVAASSKEDDEKALKFGGESSHSPTSSSSTQTTTASPSS